MNEVPPRITEKEFHTFMRPKRRFIALGTIAYCALMLGLIVAAFFVINSAAFFRQNSTPDTTVTVTPIVASTPSVTDAPIPSATPEPTQEQPSLPDNTVAYDALSISAPTHWDVAFNEDVIMAKLQDGLIHLEGTPHPGQQGISILFGHSSYYPWAKGSYKTIFAPLTQAKVGQAFHVQYKGTLYTYTVTKTYEIKADNLEILNSSTNDRGMRLITCTPIGTSLRRLVVEAAQVSPDPSGNTAFEQKSFSGKLPGDI
jgi:LPXTG-site transpeptidase (sortase) family protein